MASALRAGMVALVVGLSGCAQLTRISDEGGLVGRLLARDDAEAPDSRRVVSVSSHADRTTAIPYRAADFEHHAVNGQFVVHWSAERTGDQIEVKGLLENPDGPAVGGVTLRLSGPGGAVDMEAPGLIRSGGIRPLFFKIRYAGDPRHARLSVPAVDRAPVESSDSAARQRGGNRAAGQPAATGPSSEYNAHAHDHFFSLHWGSAPKGGEIEVSGIVENRNGPVLRDVALLVTAFGSGGQALTTDRVVLRGPFDKKAVRSFSVTLAGEPRPARVGVEVASYQFYQPRDK